MNGGDRNELNIVKTTASLPKDRESIFYLNVKAIPGRPDKAGNSLMIAVKSSSSCFIASPLCLMECLKAMWPADFRTKRWETDGL